MSFMAYFDAYQDAVAAATAFSCPAPASQRLAPWMAGYYVLGVVVLQWGVVAALSWTDPTRSCWLKLLHMDSVCARLTLPPEFKKTWSLTQIARTVGEDIPQGITQTLYVVTVTKNPFMILSICCAVGSSLLAAKDALMRRLLASGGVQQQVLLQAADEHVGGGLGIWVGSGGKKQSPSCMSPCIHASSSSCPFFPTGAQLACRGVSARLGLWRLQAGAGEEARLVSLALWRDMPIFPGFYGSRF